ncbi:MAG: hypothetical protein K2X81_26860 [Candidatus Obscuribacterales bacterium]|nr:hypothetical protein [Candidatus Obscuribacterales bacterium]
MNANWTNWNKFVVALSGILMLWVFAPRHDCFCGTMQMPEADSSASMHKCCESDTNLSAAAMKNSMQSESCACSSEHIAFAETRKVQSQTQSDAGFVPKHTLVSEAQFVDDFEAVSIADISLHNDELKPSKLFILKRSWLI